MIERAIYRHLPSLYEVRLSSESGKLRTAHERVVIMAETLDRPDISRDQVIHEAVEAKARTEGLDDLSYNMRLMRPKETRVEIIPKLRWALIRATEEQIMETSPLRKLAQIAIEHMAIITGVLETQEKTN